MRNLIFIFFIMFISNLEVKSQTKYGELEITFTEEIKAFDLNKLHLSNSNYSEQPKIIQCQPFISINQISQTKVIITNLEVGNYDMGYLYLINDKIAVFPNFRISTNKKTKLKLSFIVNDTKSKFETNYNCNKYFSDEENYAMESSPYKIEQEESTILKIPNGFKFKSSRYDGGDPYLAKFGKLTVVSNGEKSGILDGWGEWFLKPSSKYENIQLFSYIQVFYKGKTGYIDYITKKIIIPIKYDSSRYGERNDYFIVKKKGKYGVIDKFNNIYIPFKYDKIDTELGIYFIVKNNDKYGMYLKNKLITELEYDNISEDSKDSFCFRYFLNGKFGYIKRNGERLTEPIFTRLISFYESSKCGLGFIDNSEIYIDREGKTSSKNCENQ